MKIRVLALDPGAVRMGFACLEAEENKGPIYIGSGIFGIDRELNEGDGEEKFQAYRLRLIQFWIEQTDYLLRSYKPDRLANEIVPPVGGNKGNEIQRTLALTALTTVQTIALQHELPVVQYAANSIKKAIGRQGDAGKIVVRSGVIKLLPQLADRKSQWTKAFDESDALATALTDLGFKN